MTSQQKEIIWEKNCWCDSRASAPTIKIDTYCDIGDDEYKVIITFSPGPHCLKCGSPWILIK